MPDLKLSPETPSARGFFTIAGMIGLGLIWGAMGVAIALAVAFVGMYLMLTLKARTLIQPEAG